MLCLCLAGAVFAEGKSFHLRPAVGVTLGSSDYFRGAALGAHFQYNLLGIGLHLGAWTNASLDIFYENISLPIALSLGFGKDFYVLAGTTVDLSEAKNPVTGSSSKVAGFFNTFGLGLHIPIVPLGESLTLGAVIDATYTLRDSTTGESEVSDALGMLGDILAGIKVNAMVSLEFGF